MKFRYKNIIKYTIIGIIGVPIILVILAISIFYMPIVQRKIIDKAITEVQSSTGMKISIDSISLDMPLKLRLKGLSVVKSDGDTLIKAGRLTTSVELFPLLNSRIVSPRLWAEDISFSMRDSLGLFKYRTDVGSIRIHRAFVDLKNEKVNVNDLQLVKSNVYMADDDTTTKPEDPDKKPVKWHITANNLQLDSSTVYIKIKKSHLLVNTSVKKIFIHKVDADILNSIYRGDALLLESGKGQFAMKEDLTRYNDYFDYSNIEFDISKLEAEKFYNKLSDVSVNVKNFSVKEASGLCINKLAAKYQMDSIAVNVKDLEMKTPQSNIEATVHIPWSILKKDTKAHYDARVKGYLDIRDVEKAAAMDLLKNTSFKNNADSTDIKPRINIDLISDGTLMSSKIEKLNISIDDAIYLESKGELKNILEKSISGYMNLKIKTDKNINNLIGKIDQSIGKTVTIPSDTELSSILKINNSVLDINTLLSNQDREIMKLLGKFNIKNKGYDFDIKTNNLDVGEFCPQYNFKDIDANIKLSGNSFDFFNRNTKLKSDIHVYNINANGTNLNDITLYGYLDKGEINISSNSINPALNFGLQADGIINKNDIKTAITLQIDSINTNVFGNDITQIEGKCLLKGEVYSNFKNDNKLDLSINDILLKIDSSKIDVEDTEIKFKTTNQDIYLNVNSGKWFADAEIKTPINKISSNINKLAKDFDNILYHIQNTTQTKTNIDSVMNDIPSMNVKISACGDNAIKRYIERNYLNWSDLTLDMSKSEEKGLYLNGSISNLVYKKDRYEKISVDINTIKSLTGGDITTKNRLFSKIEIHKKDQVQTKGYKINSEFDTNLQDINISFRQNDNEDKTKYSATLSALCDINVYKLHINETKPIILGYKNYFVNPENFIRVTKNNYQIDSDISIADGDNSGLTILSKYENDNQNINLKINKFVLSSLKEFGIKDIGGTLFGDISYNRHGDIHQQPTISGDLSVTDLVFSNKKLGHFALAMFYETRDNTSHYVTAQLMRDGNNILSADGIYTQTTQTIDGDLKIKKLPLSLANPFIEKTTTLDGYLNSEIHANGKISDLEILGNINFEGASAKLPDYGIDAIISQDEISIKDNELVFNNFRIYSKSDLNNPITLNGNINLKDLGKIKTDLKIRAKEVTLINEGRRNDYKQAVYGKLITSTNIDVRGPVTALNIDGNLNVIAGTDINYVLQNSELSYSNKFSNLVQFTSFRDSLYIEKENKEESINGVDISIRMRIDPSVRLGVDLTPDHQNYAKIQGGGNLSFKIPNVGDMSMIGKFELQNNGELRYTLPVVGIPFNSEIAKETSLTWNGKVTNPYLNFIANSKVKTTIKDRNGKSSQVDFIVSLYAKDYVDKIDIKFDLSAPNNMDIQNQLANMNEEERAKQALSLLSTGIYLADNSAGSVDFNNTLSSIVQSQINKASNTILQGTDINIGVDHHNGDENTSTYTDYNYSISKRFLNDRIRVLLGGKLQTGNIPTNREQTLIDNLSIEYRLDRIGRQYLSLFHKRVTDDILEGEYTETGGSYLLRSKLSKFTDLFNILRIKKKEKDKGEENESQQTIFTPFMINGKVQKDSIR